METDVEASTGARFLSVEALPRTPFLSRDLLRVGQECGEDEQQNRLEADSPEEMFARLISTPSRGTRRRTTESHCLAPIWIVTIHKTMMGGMNSGRMGRSAYFANGESGHSALVFFSPLTIVNAGRKLHTIGG